MPLNNLNSERFLRSYFDDFSKLVKSDKEVINKLLTVVDLFMKSHSSGKKIIIVGNGGSAAMASHFSVDLTKNAKIRCVNFNEADLITCFSNDYGYEHWVEKAIEFYGDKNDILIAISSSGKSENIIKGVNAARRGKFKAVITFSGFSNKNPLRKLGDVNFWVNSKAYNFVENMHQIWLLAMVDLIIGDREYSA